tara:strand:- start:8133 stop:10652 length:2520 start_codon:yes stop_codon:yes gene_type:complete
MNLNLGGMANMNMFGNMFRKKEDEDNVSNDSQNLDNNGNPIPDGETGVQPTGNTVPITDEEADERERNTYGPPDDGGSLPPDLLNANLNNENLGELPSLSDLVNFEENNPQAGQVAETRNPLYYEDQFIDPLVSDVQGRSQDNYNQSLQAYASGQKMSPVVQQQVERAQQSALAAAASARGMPVSATQRIMQSGLNEAGRVGAETAAAQQIEFANMVNQLEKSRDDTVSNLIAMGVDRDKAVLDANTKLELQKKDLATKVFLGRLGSGTEIIKAGISDASWGESGSENIAENAGLLNLMLAAPGPAGIDAPIQRILTNKQQDPDALFFVQTTLPDGSQGQGQMKWNPETGTYALTSEAGTVGGYTNVGVFDDSGSPVQVYKKWNPNDNRYDYAYEPLGGESTYQGQLTGEQSPYPSAPSWVTNEYLYQQWLDQSMQYGSSDVAEGQEGPNGELTDLGDGTYQDEAGRVWTEEELNDYIAANSGFGDPPGEYGDPVKRKEYGDLDPGKYIDTISPTTDPMRLRAGAMNPLMGASRTPGLLGQGPSQFQLNKPSNALKPQFGNLPNMNLKLGNQKLGNIRPGLRPLSQTTPGTSPWRERAKIGLSTGKEILGLVGAGKDMIGAKGTKQQEAAAMKLGAYAGTKALGYGFNKLGDYLEGDKTPNASQVTAEAADQVIGDVANETVEEGVKETLKEGSSEIAKEAAKSVTKEAAEEAGEEVAKEAGGEILGAIGSKAVPALSIGKDLLGAVASKDPVGGIAKAGLKGGGAAAGAALGSFAGPVGSVVGGLLGSLAGGAAATPFQKDQQAMASYRNMQDPSRYIPEYGDPVTSRMLLEILKGRS